jgi:Flp pilus assembly protein TadD
MPDLQEQYDQAMFLFSQGEFAQAIARFQELLEKEPEHFDAQLSLGMARLRAGDIQAAIYEGHKAEKLRPHDQLVHTNLSLFYVKAGDKAKAEHHALQARIASWRESNPAGTAQPGDPALDMAKPKPATYKTPEKFPDMPWKKKKA